EAQMSDDESQQLTTPSTRSDLAMRNASSGILVANRGKLPCASTGPARVGLRSIVSTARAAALQAYLNIPTIVQVAKETGADAVHPATDSCRKCGVCQPATTLEYESPSASVAAGVPVVPGSPGPIQSAKEVTDFCADMASRLLKAAFGGGGRGMRIVRRAEDPLNRSSGPLLGEGGVRKGDSKGNVFTCTGDCSVQRRHQKVVEMPLLRTWTLGGSGHAGDAVKLMRHVAIRIRHCRIPPRIRTGASSLTLAAWRLPPRPGHRHPAGPASAYAGAIISPYTTACSEGKQLPRLRGEVPLPWRVSHTRRQDQHTVFAKPAELLGVLSGPVSTGFLDRNPQLVKQKTSKNKAQRLLFFIAETLVNGPTTPITSSCPPGWRQILLKEGPEAFAKAILRHPTVLLTDTTMRDAHQSLLATRVRTHDLIKIAPFVARRMENLLSLECWGGATFDVAMRFLHECPWDRLEELRKRIPNIPFQMLLRGANAVGYTNYPDNVVYKFCEEAVKSGMDIFRVFDCLNYIPNMVVGMDAVRKAGGVVEAALCYTGDVTRSKSTPCSTIWTLRSSLCAPGRIS
uniref:Pyruvate carboxyltransferase domain-containing protein n=1 Tax=Macrostomum lignano TaxID=282301 RepID=A0A1I8HIN7_9PLAT